MDLFGDQNLMLVVSFRISSFSIFRSLCDISIATKRPIFDIYTPLPHILSLLHPAYSNPINSPKLIDLFLFIIALFCRQEQLLVLWLSQELSCAPVATKRYRWADKRKKYTHPITTLVP
jgi:hypothetical protein